MAKPPPIFTVPQREVLADVIRLAREEERAHFDRRLNEVIEQRGLIAYRGVWDDTATYEKGAAVTVSGSLFIATALCEKGRRPGKAETWKLAVKSATRR